MSSTIKESDVLAFLTSKLEALAKSDIQAKSLSFNVATHGHYVSLHGMGECQISHDGAFDDCVADLRKKLFGDPKRVAAEKREQAAKLISEAEHFESISNSTEAPSA